MLTVIAFDGCYRDAHYDQVLGFLDAIFIIISLGGKEPGVKAE